MTQIDRIINLLARSAADGHDPIWDCQVLVAVNDKSPLSRKKMNEILQAELNKNEAVKGSPYRIGDKVVCLKNGFFPSVEESDDGRQADDADDSNNGSQSYVANGELAEVVDVQPKYFTARLTQPDRTIRVPGGGGWDLGYALSVHKSQGSEWPIVIVAIDSYPGAKMVCSREWIYTAISRAKTCCHLVGRKSVADSFCRRVAISKRKTFLRELILKEKARLEMAGL